MTCLLRCFDTNKAEATLIAPRVVSGQEESSLHDLRIIPKGNVYLCDDCQYWNNVDDIFTFMRPVRRRPDALTIMLQQNACTICRVIASAVQLKIKSLDWHVSDTNHVQIYVGGAFRVPDLKGTKPKRISAKERSAWSHKFVKCVLYLDIYNQKEPLEQDHAKKLTWHWWSAPSIGLQLLLEYDGHPVRLANVDLWEEKFIDTKAMKWCISDCETRHTGLCQKNSTKRLPAQFKLINVDELCVVDTSQFQRFVALSYMWTVHESDRSLQLEQSNLDRLSQPGGLELRQLPSIVADAIVFCRDLGEHWLWVDRFCIMQDDPVTKGIQINAMDIIYGSAVVTLVAAVDPTKATGLSGVRNRPRRSFLENDTRLFHAEGSHIDLNFFVTVDKSTRNTRGWTFQERVLSARCIYITDYQAYFTCARVIVQEELGEFQQDN